jgi:predicted Zn-dependent protease
MSPKAEPPDAFAFVDRVAALVERNRLDQARAVLGDALRKFPDNRELLYYSTYVDWAQGRLEECERTLQHLLRLDPTHPGGRIQLARLLTSRKNLAGAEKVWIELIRENPADADLYGEYAELMLNALQVKKALELAAEGLRHEPENEQCLYIIAFAKVVHGGRAKGNVELAKLVERHPERERTANALVMALEAKGRYQEAYRVSRQMLLANPHSPVWLHNVRVFKAASHWSMKPLYPFQRWGWGASIAVWFFVVLVAGPLSALAGPGVSVAFIALWVLFVIYSWVWPPILRRIV